MTPVPSSPVALLDQLDELRAKATADMPWRQDSGWGENILGASGEAIGGVEFPSDAALIVAAVNAVGPLTAAVRAVLELGNDYDDGSEWGAALFRGDVIRTAIRTAVTAALSVTP